MKLTLAPIALLTLAACGTAPTTQEAVDGNQVTPPTVYSTPHGTHADPNSLPYSPADFDPNNYLIKECTISSGKLWVTYSLQPTASGWQASVAVSTEQGWEGTTSNTAAGPGGGLVSADVDNTLYTAQYVYGSDWDNGGVFTLTVQPEGEAAQTYTLAQDATGHLAGPGYCQVHQVTR